MNHLISTAVAAAAILAGEARAQSYLMIPDSSGDKIILCDATTGAIVNASFIPDGAGVLYDFTTPKDAVQVNNETWVTDQVSDQIVRFDLNGNHIATILPAVGMVDNMRGSCFANNTFYTSSDGTGNGATADTIVMFDTSGTRLGTFSTLGSGTTPFDLVEYNGELLLSQFTAVNIIGRYDYAGNYLGAFHSSAGVTDVDSPEQLAVSPTNTVLAAGFGAPAGIYEYDATGALINSFSASTFLRGCYLLGNGLYLFTDGAGLKTLDPVGGAIVTVATGTGFQYINLLQQGPPPPVAYCTAGTSTNGCVPAISATGTPSAAATSGFTISIANVEGQQSGLIFYGVSGRAANAWGTGPSFFCVKAPVERLSVQSTGGSFGACDGTLASDWLAFMAANPTALGAPFSSGDVVNAQGWYRDPPAPKTTNLSDGLEWTMVP